MLREWTYEQSVKIAAFPLQLREVGRWVRAQISKVFDPMCQILFGGRNPREAHSAVVEDPGGKTGGKACKRDDRFMVQRGKSVLDPRRARAISTPRPTSRCHALRERPLARIRVTLRHGTIPRPPMHELRYWAVGHTSGRHLGKLAQHRVPRQACQRQIRETANGAR